MLLKRETMKKIELNKTGTVTRVDQLFNSILDNFVTAIIKNTIKHTNPNISYVFRYYCHSIVLNYNFNNYVINPP